MSNPPNDPWDALWSSMDVFAAALRKSKAVSVNSASLRDSAKQLVQNYFRQVRPDLVQLQLPDDQLNQFDEHMQRLLALSNGRNSKQSYSQVIRALRRLRPIVELERELLIGKRGVTQEGSSATNLSTGLEEAILTTLSPMVPTAALS